MIENNEQNMILKFNLKEILELNSINSNLLNDEKCSQEDKEMTIKSITENEKERERIQISLERNIKIKNILRKLLLKFISNTQVREIKDLHEAYNVLQNENRELDIKNKKYQEYLQTVLKEKEELTQLLEREKKFNIENVHKIKDLTKKLNAREKIDRTEKRRRNTRSSYGYKVNALLSNRAVSSSNIRVKSSIYKDRDRDEDNNNGNTDYLEGGNLPIYKSLQQQKVMKQPKMRNSNNLLLNNTISNNYININLTSKTPKVTTYLTNKENIKNEKEGKDTLSGGYSTVMKMKNNRKSVPTENLNNFETNINIQRRNKKKRNKTLSKSPPKKKMSDADKFMKEAEKIKKRTEKIKSFIETQERKEGKTTTPTPGHKTPTKRDGNYFIPSLPHHMSTPNNIISKKYMTTAQNYSSFNNKEQYRDKNNHNDSISLSAVTYNNEACLNNSELEIMENVLNLDGIQKQGRRTQIINSNPSNYAQQYIMRSKGRENKDTTKENNNVYNNKISQESDSMLSISPIKHRKNYLSIDMTDNKDTDAFNNALSKMKESENNVRKDHNDSFHSDK